MDKFLQHWNPSCLITIENEVYPNRNLKCAQGGIPVIFVNARMSEKSFGMWQKSPKIAKKVFACIDYCFAQDQNSFTRFAELGVPAERMDLLGNLKQFQQATPVDHPDLHNIREAFPVQSTLCAASTHKGEDQIILAAFVMAKEVRPDQTVIVLEKGDAKYSGCIARGMDALNIVAVPGVATPELYVESNSLACEGIMDEPVNYRMAERSWPLMQKLINSPKFLPTTK